VAHDDDRLSRISTQWALVFQAHQGDTEEVEAAQVALMLRYGGAIHRYLLAALRDPEAAEELDQEFALRFLRGDFHRADPDRGRFRDFIKRAIRNLIVDHYRRRKVRPHSLSEVASEPASPDEGLPESFDRQFVESWRRELMDRAWDRLAEHQARKGHRYHTVLRFRADHPEMRSPEMAKRLAVILGRPISDVGVRQALRVARDLYVGFVLSEVIRTLDAPTRDSVESELIELKLLDYCRPALARRGIIPRAKPGGAEPA